MANCASKKPARTPPWLRAGPLKQLYVSDLDERIWDEARERLRAMGVDRAAEGGVRLRRFGCLFAVARMAINGPGLFDYDEGGEWQCVIPELWDNEAVDLITFPLDAPHRMASLRGAAAMLGEHQVERSAFVEEAAVLWDDPVQWLKSGGEGGVLLDRMRPPLFLANPKLTITCASFALAEALDRAFSQPPPMPRLTVRKGAVQ